MDEEEVERKGQKAIKNEEGEEGNNDDIVGKEMRETRKIGRKENKGALNLIRICKIAKDSSIKLSRNYAYPNR